MISNVDVNVGEMYLDKGYLSRANAQLIADIGAVPYIAIKSNVKSKSYGYPAWNSMFICTKKTLMIMLGITTGEA
ncbi:MAG: hypothetical protein RXR18_01120 [Nitrososphaeria archaeon]